MYAIIETGGKQYQIEEGDIINIELIKEEKTVEFKKVLFFNDGKKIKVGTPYIENCLVTGEIVGKTKAKKVIAFKYRKRKNSKKTIGHRQPYSSIKITKITAG